MGGRFKSHLGAMGGTVGIDMLDVGVDSSFIQGEMHIPIASSYTHRELPMGKTGGPAKMRRNSHVG